MATHRLEVGLALCYRGVILSRGKAVHIAPSGAHPLEQWRALCRGVSVGTEAPAGMEVASDVASDVASGEAGALEARKP